MERMLRRIAIRKDGTISMSEFRKLAEKYQGEIYSLEEENRKLKLHIEAKDKAYTALLKDYEEIKEDRKKILDEIEKCNLNLQERLDRKEEVNKKLREELSAYDREYFDEDKKANNIFIDKSGKVIKGGEFTTLC